MMVMPLSFRGQGRLDILALSLFALVANEHVAAMPVCGHWRIPHLHHVERGSSLLDRVRKRHITWLQLFLCIFVVGDGDCYEC